MELRIYCLVRILDLKDNNYKAPLKFKFLWGFCLQTMKEIKLSPIDKFYLKNLIESIKYLKNSENTKQWLASNNYRLLIQLFKIEDEILENFK